VRPSAWWPVASFAIAALSSTAALAQPDAATGAVKRCASAYEEAQRLQARGELLAARDQASSCAAASCPAEIVRYCAKLAEELDASTPSIVVALTDARGRDIDAKVMVDEREVRDHIDGRPLRLDPGPHRVRLLPKGGAKALDIALTLRSGEQNRRIEAKLEPDPLAAAPPPRAPPAPDRIGYAPSIVAFSIGAAGIAVGAITGAMALSEDAELADACDEPARTCPPQYEDQIDRAAALGYASTIGFVLGGAGLAAGVILAVVAARGDDGPLEPTATGFRARF
jgi:hypothetical protein